MHFTLAAAALLATVSASAAGDVERRDTYDFRISDALAATVPIAKIVNRCPYDVYLWSIEKQVGCPSAGGVVLNQGAYYQEQLRNTTDGGISVKLSKYPSCGGHDLAQLEYYLNWEGVVGNFLDMSFVDCTSGDCPGWNDGFYLQSGNQQTDTGLLFPSSENNEHCPVFNVANSAQASAVAYVNWDDRQTKFCQNQANLLLYLCGSQAPSPFDTNAPASSSAAPVVPSSSSVAAPSVAAHSSASASSVSSAKIVYAAAITPTPAKVAAPSRVVKTQVVYETVYVNKRHQHGLRHGHRHA